MKLGATTSWNPTLAARRPATASADAPHDDLPAASWLKILQHTEAMPQIQRLDQFIREAGATRDRWQRSLDASPSERKALHPNLYEALRSHEVKGHERTRAWVSAASWAVSLGVTCITGLTPYSGTLMVATLLGAAPRVYDRIAGPAIEARVDERIVATVQGKRDEAHAQAQRFEKNRGTVHAQGLLRFTEQTVAEEASRRADPGACVEDGHLAVTIAGIRIPKRDGSPDPT